MILSQFQTVGRDLFISGLVSSSSGNLSIRLGDRLIITRRGCRLGCLEEQDLIEAGINKNDRSTPLASIELVVHRAIYQTTPALAIILGLLVALKFLPTARAALAKAETKKDFIFDRWRRDKS